MNINVGDRNQDFMLDVYVKDVDNNRYSYEFSGVHSGDLLAGEGEFHTINPINPLELPILILTSILENYYGERKG